MVLLITLLSAYVVDDTKLTASFPSMFSKEPKLVPQVEGQKKKEKKKHKVRTTERGLGRETTSEFSEY